VKPNGVWRQIPHGLLRSLRVGLLSLVVIFCLGPVLWQGITSVKPNAELVRLPPLFPERLTFQHYQSVLANAALVREILNSLMVATVTTILVIGIGGLCAFAIARLPLRGKQGILGLLLGISMFPPVATISTIYLVIRAAGLRDTLLALVLIHTTYALPFAIWVMTSFLRQIPIELYWAARIDGCSPLRALISVVLPPALPGVAVAALLVFIYSWNEFMFALTLTATDQARTAPVGIALFPALHEVPWGDMAAAALLVSLPLVLLAVLFQHQIVAGLTAGSVKG
jgi:multiple sugar transport system permease protein